MRRFIVVAGHLAVRAGSSSVFAPSFYLLLMAVESGSTDRDEWRRIVQPRRQKNMTDEKQEEEEWPSRRWPLSIAGLLVLDDSS